jgi:hypothetical protein
MRATCPELPIFIHLVLLMTYGEVYKARSSSVCNIKLSSGIHMWDIFALDASLNFICFFFPKLHKIILYTNCDIFSLWTRRAMPLVALSKFSVTKDKQINVMWCSCFLTIVCPLYAFPCSCTLLVYALNFPRIPSSYKARTLLYCARGTCLRHKIYAFIWLLISSNKYSEFMIPGILSSHVNQLLISVSS